MPHLIEVCAVCSHVVYKMNMGDAVHLSIPVIRDPAPDRNEAQNLSCRKLTHKNFRKLLYMLMCFKYAVGATGRL